MRHSTNISSYLRRQPKSISQILFILFVGNTYCQAARNNRQVLYFTFKGKVDSIETVQCPTPPSKSLQCAINLCMCINKYRLSFHNNARINSNALFVCQLKTDLTCHWKNKILVEKCNYSIPLQTCFSIQYDFNWSSSLSLFRCVIYVYLIQIHIYWA
jgi:hypothetical protein